MSNSHGRARRLVPALCAVAAAALCVAACGSGGSAAGGGSSAAAGSGSCSGSPVKVMTMFSQTGPLAVFGNDVPEAAKAAVAAVNKTCQAGRPLQVTVCDDQSTPNGSLECGRKADSEGDLAMLGFTAGPGGSDDGAEAANLPALFQLGQGSWDNSSKLSFPLWQGLVDTAGLVAASHALGAKTFTFAGVDVPGAHVQEGIAATEAKRLGMKFSSVFFPLTTTDYAPIAQQILGTHPGAITFLLPQAEQLTSALLDAGLSLSATKLIVNQGILTPTQVTQLGSRVDGLYQVGDFAAASDTANAGIRQMKAEFAAAGESLSPDLSYEGVDEWSSVHALAQALAGAGTKAVASLTAASIVQIVQKHGEFSLPTVIPFDFAAPVPNAETYGVSRVFSNYVGVFKTEKGVTTQVGTWQDLTKGLTLS